jgi:hypothetical protein
LRVASEDVKRYDINLASENEAGKNR